MQIEESNNTILYLPFSCSSCIPNQIYQIINIILQIFLTSFKMGQLLDGHVQLFFQSLLFK